MPPDCWTIVASALTSAHLMVAVPAGPAGAAAPAARANLYLRARKPNFLLANLLHPLLQRLDVGDEGLRLAQQTSLPHRRRPLVVGREREPLVAAEAVQQVVQVGKPDADVAVGR